MARPRATAAKATPAASRRSTPVKSRDRATSSLAARRAVLKRIRDENDRARPLLVHRSRGAPEVVRDHAAGDGGRAQRRHGLRRLVDHRLQRDRGVGHGRDPRPGHVPGDAAPLDENGQPIGAKVGRLICDVVKPDGMPYEGDPRYVLRQATERMQQLGFDTFNIGPELEYFLFEDADGTKTLDEGGYFAMTTQDAATEVRNDTIAALESVGIQIEYHHHEVAPSQHEIDMRFDDAVAMADKTLTYRLVVKEVAAWHGYYATFMPKPLFGENGSGMHTHMSLFKGGRNQFFDAKDPHHLSRWRRLHRGPARARARDVRRARAVGQLVQAARAGLRGAGLRRLVAAEPLGADPDPALQAGLGAGDPCGDPLPRSGLQPVPRFRGAAPCRSRGDREGLRAPGRDDDQPLPALRGERKEQGIVALPGSLGEAVDDLASSELMKRALGDHIFPRYVELKRLEWNEYRVQVTEWEKQRYLGAL